MPPAYPTSVPRQHSMECTWQTTRTPPRGACSCFPQLVVPVILYEVILEALLPLHLMLQHMDGVELTESIECASHRAEWPEAVALVELDLSAGRLHILLPLSDSTVTTGSDLTIELRGSSFVDADSIHHCTYDFHSTELPCTPDVPTHLVVR